MSANPPEGKHPGRKFKQYTVRKVTTVRERQAGGTRSYNRPWRMGGGRSAGIRRPPGGHEFKSRKAGNTGTGRGVLREGNGGIGEGGQGLCSLACRWHGCLA